MNIFVNLLKISTNEWAANRQEYLESMITCAKRLAKRPYNKHISAKFIYIF